jgi:hypothetical protein
VARALRGAVVGEAVAVAPIGAIDAIGVSGARAMFRDTWIGAMLSRVGITGLIDARPVCMMVALRE